MKCGEKSRVWNTIREQIHRKGCLFPRDVEAVAYATQRYTVGDASETAGDA